MGTLIGHVAPGAGFLLIGLWHLFNTIRNYAHGPWNFETRPWFPAKVCRGKLRHMELYAIMGGSLLSIASELFIGPAKHQPLANDFSIPSDHLNNFEHSTISLFLFIYALVALLADTCEGFSNIRLPFGLVHTLGALAFAQELLLFHLHSADHMGLEGHYHWLLQSIISVSLACTLLEVQWPQSFLVALFRSLSVVYQGVWFIQMGLVLWVPAFTPKGCRLRQETLHRVVRCEDEASTMRAKALATLQFSWYLAALMVFTVLSLVLAIRFYSSARKYESIEEAVAAEDRKVELSTHPLQSRSLDSSHSWMEGFKSPSVSLER